MQKIEEPDVTPLINVNLMVLVMALLISSHAAKLLPLHLPKVKEPQGRPSRETVKLSVGAGACTLKLGQARLALKGLAELDGWMGEYEALRDELAELRGLKKRMGPGEYKAKHGPQEADRMAKMQKLTANGFAVTVGREDLKEAAKTLTEGWTVVVATDADATYESLGWAVDCLMGNPSLQAFVETKDAVSMKVGKDSYTLGSHKGLDKEQLAQGVKDLDDGVIVLVSMDPKAKYEMLVWAMDQMMDRPSLKVAFGEPPAPAAAAKSTTPPAGR